MEQRIDLTKMACPYCNKKSLRRHGVSVTIKGKKQRYECRDCGNTFFGTAIADKMVKDLNEVLPTQKGTKSLRFYVNSEELMVIREEQIAEVEAKAEEVENFDGDPEDKYAEEEENAASKKQNNEELGSDADPPDW